MSFVQSKAELRGIAIRWGMRDDWHEPDEQGVTFHFEPGTFAPEFDNAMGDETEAHVVLLREGERVEINLADLLAWACR